ncbi:penicillin-binding protein 2 [Rhodobacterales bacterium HKCCE2091]|nr:penicillin-binding protein 2 [Rhodobacterales bacterium HKCCE2091]
MKRSQKETEEEATQVTRRGLILGGLMGTTAGVLALRMRYLQVERASDFRMLAEDNRISDRLIPPDRGLIFDRHGTLLAGNEQNYRITMIREDVDDVDAVLHRLSQIVLLDPARLARVRDEIMNTPAFVPVTIADRLSWEELSAVAVNAPALPGITPEFGLSRVYPLGPDFVHVVGYVRDVPDSYAERSGDPDPVLRIPDFQVGLLNVEEGLEQALRGRAGIKRVEVNARGRVMRELDRTEPTPGSDLQLTIDAGLQNYTEARLNGESAGAVVMDCRSGEILALASAPSFDPNIFVRPLSAATYNGLLNDPYRPLANKATQGLYPPGSTYKMIVALAALEQGLVTPDETVYCGGYTELGNRRFHCWRRGGHGRLSLEQALEQSCDVYFYDLAQRVGIEAMSAMARRLGCGVQHDLPLSSVAAGLAPTMAWKRANRGADWLIGDTLNASIGQGFVLASPLQLAVMTARIASGRALVPQVVKTVDGIDHITDAAPPLDIAREHLDIVRSGMNRVINAARGTAHGIRVESEEYRMAGKSGTSQVRNITAAERAAGVTSNEDLPWERRDHALFVAFGPVASPRYACSVVVEHGSGGSSVAGPIARDLLLRAQVGDVPPLTLYPSSQRQRIDEMHENMNLLPLARPAPSSGGSSQA